MKLFELIEEWTDIETMENTNKIIEEWDNFYLEFPDAERIELNELFSIVYAISDPTGKKADQAGHGVIDTDIKAILAGYAIGYRQREQELEETS